MKFFLFGLALLSYSLGFSQKSQLNYKVCIYNTGNDYFENSKVYGALQDDLLAVDYFDFLQGPFLKNEIKCSIVFTHLSTGKSYIGNSIVFPNKNYTNQALFIPSTNNTWIKQGFDTTIGLGLNKNGHENILNNVSDKDIVYVTHYVDLSKISENRPSSVFSVSPNPVKGPLTISWHENIKDSLKNIEIISLSDNKVMSVSFVSEEMKTETNVLSDKLPGVYIVKLTLKDGKAFTKKVIKQ
jgi:hypothetical protein